MGMTMLVTSFKWRVVVLGECMYRNSQPVPVPGAGGDDGDVEQGLAVPRQQLCFSSGLEELADLQQQTRVLPTATGEAKC